MTKLEQLLEAMRVNIAAHYEVCEEEDCRDVHHQRVATDALELAVAEQK